MDRSTDDGRRRTIVGTAIVGDALRPFVLDTAANTVQFDIYDPAPATEARTSSVPEDIVVTLNKLLGSPVDAVRPGEYYCSGCGNWFPANKDCWSLTICLYCSLDRGSELAEYYEKLERPS